MFCSGVCAEFRRVGGYGHDRLLVQEVLQAVVQLCGLSNPFLQRYVIDLVSLYLPEVVCILLVG